MKAYDVLGCTDDGAAFCKEHCPTPPECEDEHGAIFADSEWDCCGPVCDVCHTEIEGPTVLHNSS